MLLYAELHCCRARREKRKKVREIRKYAKYDNGNNIMQSSIQLSHTGQVCLFLVGAKFIKFLGVLHLAAICDRIVGSELCHVLGRIC